MELNKSYKFEFVELKEPNIISINVIKPEKLLKFNNLDEWRTTLVIPRYADYKSGDAILFSQHCVKYIRGRFIRYREDLGLCEIYATDQCEILTVPKEKLCSMANEKIKNFCTKECYNIQLYNLELGEYVSIAEKRQCVCQTL